MTGIKASALSAVEFLRKDTFGLAALFLVTLSLCEYTSDIHWGLYVPALMLISVLFVHARRVGALNLRFRNPEVWVSCVSITTLLGISAWLSPDPYISLIEVESFVVLFMAVIVFSGRKLSDIRAIFIAGGLPMAVFAIQGVAQSFTQQVNAHAALHDSNLLAAFLMAGAAALGGVTVSTYASGRKTSANCFVLLACTLGVGAYFAHSRGAWLAVAVSLALTLLVTRSHTRLSYLRIVFILAAVSVVGAVCVAPKTQRDVAQHDHYGQSTNSRLAMWKSTCKMIEEHPFKGVGFGLWHLEYPKYRTADDTDSAGYRAHNDYLEAWASGGLFGALAVMTIPALWANALILSRRRKLQDKWIFVGASAAGGVFVFQAIVNFIYHEPSVALYAGLTIGAMYSQLREDRAVQQNSFHHSLRLSLIPIVVTVWALIVYLVMAPTLVLGNPYGFEARHLGALMEPRVLELLAILDPLAADPEYALGQEQMLQGITSKTGEGRVRYLSSALTHFTLAERRQGVQASTSYKKAMITLLLPGLSEEARQSRAAVLLRESLGRNPGYWPSVNAYTRVLAGQGKAQIALVVVRRAAQAVPLYQRRQFQSLGDQILSGKLEPLTTP